MDLIGRAVHLWSSPGEIVFDPFTGIGSTGVVALEMGRRFVGSELKKAYWEQACANIAAAAPKAKGRQTSLFDIAI